MHVFLRSRPGFAFYRKDKTTVFSLMNLVQPCRDEAMSNCRDEEILKSFESAWTPKDFLPFKTVEAFGPIRDRDGLIHICKENLRGLTPLHKYDPDFVECVN